MKPAIAPTPRAEPFQRPQTFLDADRFFTIAELLRVLEREVEAEKALWAGQRGQTRRAILLARCLPYARGLARALAPLAGIGEL